MTQRKGRKRANPQEYMPDAERVASELAKAESYRLKEKRKARLFGRPPQAVEAPNEVDG